MLDGIRKGVTANLPVGLSVGAYGSVLGVLAARQQLGWGELLAMNLSIFAGSAQFVMVEMWRPPLPILEITLAVLAVNLRYLLIGASLQPVFQRKPLLHKALMMHLVADENWAVTMAAQRRGQGTAELLLGGGLCLLTFWCTGTLLGHRLGAAIQHPETYALDFAFTAVFTALAVGLWRDAGRDAVPWAAAAGLAVLANLVLPGKWYIVIGGLGGALASLLPVVFHPRRRPRWFR